MRTKNIPNREKAPSPTGSHGGDLREFAALAADVALCANGVTPKKSTGITPTRKGQKKSKSDPRGYRWQLKFWLDSAKEEQLALGRWIHELKLTKQFAPTVRKALALYRELMAGKYNMLYEEFPETKPAPPVSPERIREMEEELKKLRKEHDILEGQVAILEQVIISTRLPAALEAVKMADRAGEGAPVRTPRALSAPPPVIAAAAVEVDTSSAFLDAF